MTVFVTVFVRVIPLEMQKRIVNQAIKLKAFELLMIYCGLYLAAVVTAGGLKFVIGYLSSGKVSWQTCAQNCTVMC